MRVAARAGRGGSIPPTAEQKCQSMSHFTQRPRRRERRRTQHKTE
nr:MAG TPA: hypothetical protein [Caudoviricetes sp.]